MKILVTGASGLIGRHTLQVLQQGEHAVRTFQRTPIDGVESITGDIRTDRDRLCAAASDCSAVIHLAGRGDVGESRHDPLGYAELNATGALHALEAARSADAAFILASSQRVYPLHPAPCREDEPLAPDSPYGYAKWVAELWCRMAAEQFGVPTRVLRFFSVYGPGQQANGGSGVVSIFAHAALAGAPLVVQSAGRRDFTDARDVARGIVCAAVDSRQRGGFGVYNVATGHGTTFLALAHLVRDLSGSTSAIEEHITEPVGRDLVADVSLAQNDLDFTADIDLRGGIQHYLQWLQQQSCS